MRGFAVLLSGSAAGSADMSLTPGVRLLACLRGGGGLSGRRPARRPAPWLFGGVLPSIRLGSARRKRLERPIRLRVPDRRWPHGHLDGRLAVDDGEEHLVDKHVRIKVGNLDCRCSDGGARGRRNLVEYVADAVHSSAKVTPEETLDPFRIGR